MAMSGDFLASLLKVEAGLVRPVAGEDTVERYIHERYASDTQSWKRKLYYLAKPIIPRPVQLALRRKYVGVQSAATFPAWPIEPILVNAADQYLRETLTASARNSLYRIALWPDKKNFAFAITHDVEMDRGLRRAPALAAVEKRLGFLSSWNLVPERYPIDWSIVEDLKSAGCEIGIHGLKHDGKLFQSRRTFVQRASRINQYAKDWGAVGFRSPSTLRNIDWMPELQFQYDSSFPDTDPYEPQPGGCCSIWPFFIGNLVELPLSMPQDHTLFEILGHRDLALWGQKASWIEQNSGLVLINVHPDYIDTDERLALYEGFLREMKEKRSMWHARPREIAEWWREREASSLVLEGEKPTVRGPIARRATTIQTAIHDGRLTHDVCS